MPELYPATAAPSLPAARGPHGYGLDAVVAADTELSHVDGAHGRLIVRGYDLPDLAARFSTEGVVGLLLEGIQDPERADGLIRPRLGAARLAVYGQIERLLAATRGLDITCGLRAALAALPTPPTDDALHLIAATPVLAAALIRQERGQMPVAPDATLSLAADFLRMIRGDTPSAHEARALDAYLVTIADHGLNASTFTARVVASTAADMVSGAVAALGALKGPRHGGAPGPVLDMLDAIEASGDPEGWIKRALASGDRLMGFGHRLYRTRDPRADVLKAVLARLGDAGRIKLAERVEAAALIALRAAKPDRPLLTNVEFFTALLLEALAIPRAAFTASFAVGRMIGWCAHMAEHRRYGRLIRPTSRYVGPELSRT